MKHLALTAALLLATTSSIAIAEDAPATKGPPVTMGDEGKLPATDTMTGRTPEMGATEAPAATGPDASVKGPAKKMGDEGKLPATGTVSGATPQMTPPPADGAK